LVQRPVVLRSLLICLVALAIGTTTGCSTAPKPTSSLGYLKALERSHQLDSKAVKACTQGYTPEPKPLAARDSTLRFVRTLMRGTSEYKRDSILTSRRQGYAAICIFKTTDNGKPVTIGAYHLTPPSDGVGSGDGGGLLEW
jgi:hypothetical protein